MPDPYGYVETAPPPTGGLAAQAMYAGVFALICAAMGPCLCYVPYLAAIPLGGYALYAGSQVRSTGDALGAAEGAMATGGMIAGGVAAMLGMFVVLLGAAYFVLVFGAIAMGN